MVKVYIVRAEYWWQRESYICGLYPTKQLADARCKYLKDNDGFGNVWLEIVEVGPEGGDCMISD